VTYEDFRDRIRNALATAEHPLTWTEIRASENLPQAYPNNQWVRRMESDIGLVREKDKTGKMFWRLR
jgi:hypothetical protein